MSANVSKKKSSLSLSATIISWWRILSCQLSAAGGKTFILRICTLGLIFPDTSLSVALPPLPLCVILQSVPTAIDIWDILFLTFFHISPSVQFLVLISFLPNISLSPHHILVLRNSYFPFRKRKKSPTVNSCA